MINGEPTNPGSETLVQPELIPPVHSDKVTEPLMGKFMGNDICYPVAIAVCRCRGIEENCSSSGLIVSGLLSTRRSGTDR
jgi:hypothetical protein